VGANYYFLVSSLPSLRLGTPPPMSSQSFLDRCGEQLTPAELARLQTVALLPNDDASTGVERAFQAREIALRNLLARYRGKRLQRDHLRFLRPEPEYISGLESQVEEILRAPHPLAMKQATDALRWRWLEELTIGNYFSFNTLVIYRLKLLILEKHAAYNAEAGQAALERLLTSKLANVNMSELLNADQQSG
jgi:hypothetical protein